MQTLSFPNSNIENNHKQKTHRELIHKKIKKFYKTYKIIILFIIQLIFYTLVPFTIVKFLVTFSGGQINYKNLFGFIITNIFFMCTLFYALAKFLFVMLKDFFPEKSRYFVLLENVIGLSFFGFLFIYNLMYRSIGN